MLFEPIVQPWVALSGHLRWRLDARLIVALLRLVVVEYLLSRLAQICIRSLQVLRLSLIGTQIISHLNYVSEFFRMLPLPLGAAVLLRTIAVVVHQLGGLIRTHTHLLHWHLPRIYKLVLMLYLGRITAKVHRLGA